MQYGAFEQSGDARLIVLRKNKLLLVYSTPFNPIPVVMEGATPHSAARPRQYSLQIWQDERGKVFSANWDIYGTEVISLCRNGPWRSALREIGRPQAVAAPSQPQSQTLRTTAKAQNAAVSKFRALEQENEQLRRTLSTILFEKLAPFDSFGRGR